MTRDYYRNKSNNPSNPNKNICCLAVTDVYKVSDKVNYLQTIDDIVRALRTTYTVRSRKSALRVTTVGKARAKIAHMASTEKDGIVVGYLLRVITNKGGHSIILGQEGQTLIDTLEQKSDRRRITHCYVILMERT